MKKFIPWMLLHCYGWLKRIGIGSYSLIFVRTWLGCGTTIIMLTWVHAIQATWSLVIHLHIQKAFHKLHYYNEPSHILMDYIDHMIFISKKWNYGSVALFSHFHKVLALSKFALLKCKIEVNPLAWIPWATSTTQIEIRQCWWLWGSLQFRNLKVRNLKVVTLCESEKVKQHYYVCRTYLSLFTFS